jgi:hypothetical protein
VIIWINASYWINHFGFSEILEKTMDIQEGFSFRRREAVVSRSFRFESFAQLPAKIKLFAIE